jgi:hypothetical protein
VLERKRSAMALRAAVVVVVKAMKSNSCGAPGFGVKVELDGYAGRNPDSAGLRRPATRRGRDDLYSLSGTIRNRATALRVGSRPHEPQARRYCL